MKKHEKLAEDLLEFLIRVWAYKGWKVTRSMKPARDKYLNGVADYRTKEITLYPMNDPRTQPGEVLGHELLHIAHDGHITRNAKGEQLEKVVGILGKSLYRCGSKRMRQLLDAWAAGDERAIQTVTSFKCKKQGVKK